METGKKRIYVVTKEEYDALYKDGAKTGSVTYNGTTYTWDSDGIYIIRENLGEGFYQEDGEYKLAPASVSQLGGIKTKYDMSDDATAPVYIDDDGYAFVKHSISSISTDATLTGGTITDTGTIGINLSNPNTWAAAQNFIGGLQKNGKDVPNVDDLANVVEDARFTEILYSDLLTLVNTSNLIKGMQYRIIDYAPTCTTSTIKYAGHQFDIIVTADSTSTLNKTCRFAKHDGDTYFANCDLPKWTGQYDINGTITPTSGNEFGLITDLKDEFGNECGYDFKNLTRLGSSIQGYTTFGLTTTAYYYTFSSGTDTGATDLSIAGTTNDIHDNDLSKIAYDKQITFLGTGCYSNTFGPGCYSNTFGPRCRSNTFGPDFSSNTFGSGCYYNTFDSGCQYNTFGNDCYSNTFGSNCYSNTFDSGCQYNTFGLNCYSNTFGVHCYSNTFGSYCYSNTFGLIFQYNTFGSSCCHNTFDLYCCSNTFGLDCVYLKATTAISNKVIDSAIGGASSSNQFDIYCSSLPSGLATLSKDSAGNYIWLWKDSKNHEIGYYKTSNTDTVWKKLETDNLSTEIDRAKAAEAATDSSLNNHIIDSSNPHQVTKTQVGLGNVDNTSDADKPVSTEQRAAIDASHLTEILYADLVALVNAKNLVPGVQYRITDYKPTNSGTDSTGHDFKMAGHQFDIIVTADDSATLNENARAALHDGDTYFASSNLAEWKLKYSIENDVTKFDWADAANGKGVIYRMIDEWGNDCPYDFKNIQFIRKITNGALDLFISGVDTWVYTFNAYDIDSSNILDGSLLNGLYQLDDADIICKNNTIKSYNQEDLYDGHIRKQKLNDIVFLNTYSLDDPAYFECYSNSFGNGCHSNTFGNGCHSNTFGDGCNSNTFGDDYNSNTFDDYCYSNTFGNSCYSNTFGNGCHSNTFGNGCHSNTFGNSCYSNTFGNSCYSNTFGDGCNSNTFGNSCYSNTFGDGCNSNTFGNGCYFNTFGNGCHSNTFGNSCSSNTFGTTVNNVKIAIDYCRWNKIDNGVSFIEITSADTTATSDNCVQNVRICLGVHGASSTNPKLIVVPDRNLQYQSLYKATGSTETEI